MAKKKNNSRKINALLPKKFLKTHIIKKNVALHIRNYLLIILFFQASLLLVVLVFVGFALFDKERLRQERVKSYVYWSNVASQYPTKPDILFNAGKSAYESGDKAKAIEYIEKALQMDPLFEKAMDLRQEMGE